ncbi:hypothetical protein V8F06_002466 [Rhypophila decipiens]
MCLKGDIKATISIPRRLRWHHGRAITTEKGYLISFDTANMSSRLHNMTCHTFHAGVFGDRGRENGAVPHAPGLWCGRQPAKIGGQPYGTVGTGSVTPKPRSIMLAHRAVHSVQVPLSWKASISVGGPKQLMVGEALNPMTTFPKTYDGLPVSADRYNGYRIFGSHFPENLGGAVIACDSVRDMHKFENKGGRYQAGVVHVVMIIPNRIEQLFAFVRRIVRAWLDRSPTVGDNSVSIQ